MDKKKQISQEGNVGVTPAMYWITLALGVIFCLIGWLGIRNLDTEAVLRTGQIAVYVLVIAGTLGGIVLTISGRQQLGAQFIYFAVPILGLMSVVTTNGAIIGAFVVLLVNVIASYSIFSSWLRRRYLIISIAAFILSWVIEWINPPWREGTPQHIEIGVISVIAFVIIAASIVAIQVWRLGSSLRNKLVVGITTLTIISIIILAFTNYYNDQKNLTASSGAALKSTADTQASAVGNALLQEAHVLQSFDLSKLVQDRVDEVNAQYGSNQAENVRQIQLLDTHWRNADKADNNNDPLVKNVIDSEVASELREFTSTFPENVEVFVTDKYGANIAATNRTSDYYQADEEWWQAAYNNGRGAVYFGQPEFDQSSKTFGVILAVPLYSHGTQEVSGVMRTTINIESILAILNAKILNGTGHINLYLPAGQVLDPENENGVRPTDPNALELLPELISTKTYASFVLDGVPSVVSAAQVTSTDPEVQAGIKNLGWQIVVDQSQADNLAPVRQQTQSTVVIALIILAISAVLGIFLAQLLSNPIVRLTSVAEQIAAGDITRQAKVETADEIGKLASTFNSMTAQLRELIGSLEQRVASRTRNLELAAQVGRTVSQVRSLDVMLKDACELILKEFGLYYVQVYLTDASQTTLKLEAGTGNAGAQLLGRGHSLPLNTGSINGRAAVEKRPVVISDTTKSAVFRQNSLLPETRGEMAIPLVLGDRVVGVLDMQSREPGMLNEEVLPAFEALAGQMAVAIQNANLLAETEQARIQVEAQARRLVREGWNEHLDAIHKPEQIGFVFNHNQVVPLNDIDGSQFSADGQVISAPIAVTGESLGSLAVEVNDESRREQTGKLVEVVARQVAQQIENLRLLESAERYRAVAEDASRRLTREGWKTYVENTNENLSYFYDLQEVRPFTGNGHDQAAMSLPLKIHDETIGKLAIQGIEANDSQAFELANAVAERLSSHIESLRQFEETKRGQIELDKRARQLAAVAEISTVSSKELDVQKMLESVVYLAQRQFGLYHAHIFTYNESTQELQIAACGWEEGNEHEGTHEKNVIALTQEQSLVARAARTRQAIIANNVRNETGWLPNPLLPDTKAEMAVPLIIGDQILGVLDVQSDQLNAFSDEDANIQSTLASQVATALQNAHSFARAQQQANRESTLNMISQKIQSATSVEAVLQIAARELGHALGAPMTVAQLSMKDKS
jgi:GAF domain-containing protein/HAMP domain-containing protein